MFGPKNWFSVLLSNQITPLRDDALISPSAARGGSTPFAGTPQKRSCKTIKHLDLFYDTPQCQHVSTPPAAACHHVSFSAAPWETMRGLIHRRAQRTPAALKQG